MLRFANASLDRWIDATMVTEGAGIGWMRNPKPVSNPKPSDACHSVGAMAMTGAVVVAQATFSTCDWVIPRAAPGHVQVRCPPPSDYW